MASARKQATSAAADDDPFDLARFTAAQDEVWPHVQAELRAGEKRSHWMWFVFPQLKALGRSATAIRYGIASMDEAQAYIAHPILGPRLRACSRLLLDVEGRSIESILPHPDNLKLNSSMTLFALATPDNAIFANVINRYFQGQQDDATVRLLLADR